MPREPIRPAQSLSRLRTRGIVQILRFSGIDEDDLSWKPIRVRQVDVAVLDHGSIGGIDDGVEKLVFDLMEFGISHAEALLRNPIIGIHQARQHCSIRRLGHLHAPLKVGDETRRMVGAGQTRLILLTRNRK